MGCTYLGIYLGIYLVDCPLDRLNQGALHTNVYRTVFKLLG